MRVCLCRQGRDEFGDLARGPSEESNEQYTDYESSDVSPARHGSPGVTAGRREPPPGSGAGTSKTELADNHREPK